MAFEDMVKQAMEAAEAVKNRAFRIKNDPEELKKLYRSLQDKHHFQPGDLVSWKPGMQNRNPDGPYIVIEVLKEPILDKDKDTGSPYYREPLDIVLGHADPERGVLICHYHDSRRLQPYEEGAKPRVIPIHGSSSNKKV